MAEEKDRKKIHKRGREKKHDPDPDDKSRKRHYDEIDDIVDNAENIIEENEENTKKKETNAQ